MGLNDLNQASTYIIESQEEEIKRIALELHEGICQNLYSLNTGLGFLQTGLDNPELKGYAKELSELMNRTIQEVRLLSLELYPSTLMTLGLKAALKSYIKLYTSTFGIVINFQSIGEEWPISEPKSLALFRACQEALINIAKYADTSEAKLTFIWSQDSLQVVIEDDGVGFDFQTASKNNTLKGIAAMKQRMIIAGGDCHLDSGKDKGTRVTISLPFQKQGEL